MRFGSVCSGIEAASVAWHPLGWRAAWLAEIEPFPSAVLAHHYPEVPNLGDMSLLPARIAAGEVEAPDVFCGGTPCQAFSVAGLRRSLDDARGNLSLIFCEIADAIDHARAARGEQPAIVFWENVPGVLSTKDNAFGCFLAGLAGEDDALVAPGGKWSDAGVVLGPQRAVAWRVLDAQYFGLAQRRRRVFVVASARDDFDPAAVLFEWQGVRRDTAPSREAGKVAPTIPARSTAGGGLGSDFDCGGGLIQAFGGNRTSGPIDVSPALNACGTASGRQDFETEAFITTTHTLRGEGLDASEDGTGRGTPLVPVNFQASQSDMRVNDTVGTLDANYGSRRHNGVMVPLAFQPGNLSRGAGSDPSTDVFPTLKSDHGRGRSDQDPHVMVPVAFHPTQDPISSADGTTHAMGCGSKGGTATVAVAFTQNSRSEVREIGGDGGIVGALAADAGAQQQNYVAVAVALRGRDGGATAELGDEVQNCLRASGGGGDKAHVLAPVAFTTKLHNTQSNQAGKVYEEYATSLDRSSPPPALLTAMQVRRLTPRECERLQGCPDDYTLIPWRGKPADQCPDGPRYKALGNSWAVPVVRWIGARINDQMLLA